MGQIVTQADFARRLGVDRAHVTRLKQAGRLVLGEGGVDAERSMARIEATGGLRPDVAHRHAVARERAHPPRQAAAGGADGGGVEHLSLGAARDLLARSKARREAALAEKEEMERDLLAGRLVERGDAERAMRELGAAVRAAMDAYADQVAPLVLPLSALDEVHAVLAEQCRNVLVQVGEAIGRQQAAMSRR